MEVRKSECWELYFLTVFKRYIKKVFSRVRTQKYTKNSAVLSSNYSFEFPPEDTSTDLSSLLFGHEDRTTLPHRTAEECTYYDCRETKNVQIRKVEVVLMVSTILSAIQVENRSFVSLIFPGHTYLS